MIANSLCYELSQMCPDAMTFFVDPDDDDQAPPYFTVNIVDGAPNGSGNSGRWQIRIVHGNKEFIEADIAVKIRERFHNQSGLFGTPGSEDDISLCGVVMESMVSKGANSGVYYKDIDLKIYYR